MKSRLRNIASAILFMIGVAFLGAGFNAQNTDNDTLFRIIAALCILAALALFALYVRDNPVLRTPMALAALGAMLVGVLLIVTTDDTFGSFQGIAGICLFLGGTSPLSKLGTAATAETAPEA